MPMTAGASKPREHRLDNVTRAGFAVIILVPPYDFGCFLRHRFMAARTSR
jgi:hypothetical protein